MAPTPGPGGTDVHIPGPGDVNPDKGFDIIAGAPEVVWKIVAAVIIIAVGTYIINKLPWKSIGMVAIVILLFVIFAK